MIVRPLEPWLSQLRNWVIIPDGALDYVPFAALPMQDAQPESLVVLQHDVAVTPAAWTLDTRGSRAPLPHRRKILLVADPVYQADDPRAGNSQECAGGGADFRPSCARSQPW